MFSSLLPEVIYDYIFPYLLINDLLRLRRVSKVSKDLAETYLRLHGCSTRVIYIDEYVLPNFLALPFEVPVSRIRVYCEDDSELGSEQMRLFLNRYGHRIRHLEIDCLEIPMVSGDVVQFFEGLPNLKELRVVNLYSTPHSGQDPVSPDLNLPSTLKRLQNLRVRHYESSSSLQGVQILWTFLNECTSHAEYILHPVIACLSRGLKLTGGEFDCVKNIVEMRHRENPEKPNLKYYDLEEFRDDPICGDEEEDDIHRNNVKSFYELVTTCSAHGVKLQNVEAALIEEMMKLDTPDRWLHGEKISKCVVSIKGLTKSFFHLELPTLEKIDLGTSSCSMPEENFQAQPWTNLKELEVWVDSEHLAEDGDGERVEVSRLFEFFFQGIRRDNLESLDLSYFGILREFLPYPSMANVCSSCPILKKLHLARWPGRNNGDIVRLWENIPLLEHVSFGMCEHLGDAAFLGDDVTRPSILKATRLKRLELLCLDEMPGITDDLFTSALRHMPLKALYLTSHDPVTSITVAGLESLLTGKFAETIERFPLKGIFKLEGVIEQQLTELEGKFRSSHM